MTSVVSGSETLFFCNRQEIVEHLLGKILANKKRCIGTEWEMFFINPQGKPITRVDGQKAFLEFKNVFAVMGYESTYIYEKSASGSEKVVGLNIRDLGVIVPEAGYQLEFACSVCESCDEIKEKNEDAYRVISEVAQRLGYTPIFKGHLPGYASSTEGMDRSRGIQWRDYYNNRFGAGAMSVREAQDGTASVQITIDAGAEKFHEFFQALLLIEPALTLYYANSQRSYVGMQAYGRLIPSQVKPIVEVWDAKNPKEALEAIVDRLMEIDVPFLPDPEWPGLYKAEPLIYGRPPTIEDLMKQGRLNEKILNNVGGFFYTRPALKNFSQALLEMRGVDSQPTPEKVVEVAQRVTSLLYNDATRTELLADYSYLTLSDVYKMHEASTMKEKKEGLSVEVAGVTMASFMQDIIARSQVPDSQELYASLVGENQQTAA